MIPRNERDVKGRFHVPTQDEDFDAMGAAQHAIIRRHGEDVVYESDDGVGPHVLLHKVPQPPRLTELRKPCRA